MRRGFWFVIILSRAKKMFSEPNINTSPRVEKGAKGKTKYFEKNHCTRLLLIPHTKYRTEQHNKDRGYFLPYLYIAVNHRPFKSA